MQVSKGKKDVKNAKRQENQRKLGGNQSSNYQKGLIRNMCEEVPKNSGKSLILGKC